jgi:hypothetical protein
MVVSVGVILALAAGGVVAVSALLVGGDDPLTVCHQMDS